MGFDLQQIIKAKLGHEHKIFLDNCTDELSKKFEALRRMQSQRNQEVFIKTAFEDLKTKVIQQYTESHKKAYNSQFIQ